MIIFDVAIVMFFHIQSCFDVFKMETSICVNIVNAIQLRKITKTETWWCMLNLEPLQLFDACISRLIEASFFDGFFLISHFYSHIFILFGTQSSTLKSLSAYFYIILSNFSSKVTKFFQELTHVSFLVFRVVLLDS